MTASDREVVILLGVSDIKSEIHIGFVGDGAVPGGGTGGVRSSLPNTVAPARLTTTVAPHRTEQLPIV